jgi:vacuolar-type H+-ATPase subunit I/STV1
MNWMAFIPLTSAIICFIFAGLVFQRYLQKHHTHNLLWAIGILFYGIGGACEAYYGFFGWNPLVFRLWYLFGAILVAAWLGQGTVYLLAKPRIANIFMGILATGSLYAIYRVFTARLDPSLMTSSLHTGSELSGSAIVSEGVRNLTPFFNLYGTVTLVGGALYSAFLFWRKRVLLHRVIGNVLIATGAILPAFGGTFSRFGIPGALYITELLGAILLFIGFMRATTPMRAEVQVTQVATGG